jgi:hypothetical protein
MSVEVDEIFVRADENQRERRQWVTLKDGFRLALKTQYIATIGHWAAWILDLDGTELYGPILLVKGYNLLTPYQYGARVPKGTLWVSGEEMTLANAGITSRLLYRRAT